MTNLFDLVKNIKGAQFANIVYTADCGLPKKSGFGKVEKRVRLNVQLNYNYCEVIRKRIERKGGNPNTFTKESLPWGSWEIFNKVISHKGERYLRYYSVKGEYPSVEFFVNGVAATPQQEADIKAYLQSNSKTSEKQAACGLTDDEQVIPRCVKFANIESLAVDGKVWTKPTSAAA